MREENQNDSLAASSVAAKVTQDYALRPPEKDIDACCKGIRNQRAQFHRTGGQQPAVSFNISGMHCLSCAGRVETAFTALDGVADASVDMATHKATVWYDPAMVDIEDLKAALTSAGYEFAENDPEDLKPVPECCTRPVDFSNPRAYLLGVLASFAIVGVYLGMNTLTSDWYFARVQFSEYRWWIISLAFGLGIQVTLFTLFRAHLRGKKKTAAKSSMVASGGVSAVAMMACCSHYLATLIPLLGVSFLSATAVASLAQYQPYFFLAGLVSCLFGITLLVRMMRKHGMFKTGIPRDNPQDLKCV